LKTNENVYTLSKPAILDGNELKELNLDFDSLTGEDLEEAAVEFQINGNSAPVIELSKPYLAIVVARAAKVPTQVIRKLPAKDYSKLTVRAQNFLLR
jgi:hypothetical protein